MLLQLQFSQGQEKDKKRLQRFEPEEQGSEVLIFPIGKPNLFSIYYLLAYSKHE